MKKLLSILCVTFALAVFGGHIYYKGVFKREVTAYLRHAADASTIEMADAEMTKALNYLEAKGMTSGSTSIIWESPDDDIDFWYNNLKAAQTEIRNPDLETVTAKDNALMKLRQTILYHGGEGKEKVRLPDGIAKFPHNTLWTGLGWGAFFALFAPFLIYWEELSEADRAARAAAAKKAKAPDA